MVGASGYIGTNLVPRLVERGYPVRATARDIELLTRRGWRDVELMEVDLTKPDTLPHALQGMDIAYYLVHSMAAGRNFPDLDLTVAAHFAEAAQNSPLQRIVYLGGLIPQDADSKHLLSRRDTGRQLSKGKVPVTEIRAGIIVGPGSAAFEVIRDIVNYLPIMITPRWVYAKSPPIALDNLLEYLVRIATLDEAAGRVYDAAGPEQLSYKELMLQYGQIVGKRPTIVPVPILTPNLSSYWLHLITSVPTNVARALIEGLKHDIHADPAALRALIPLNLLSYREAVSSTLKAEREHVVPTQWVEGALMARDFNPKYSFYAKKASGSAVAQASSDDIWCEVAAIGGDNRYYYLDTLWALRETADWVIGGPGLDRGRRHPTEIKVGDVIDSWRVIGVEPGRRLSLGFGMKAPGAGVLEFDITPETDGQTRVTATAYWHPAGIWGILYWLALEPFHKLIFDGMTAEIAKRAADRA